MSHLLYYFKPPKETEEKLTLTYEEVKIREEDLHKLAVETARSHVEQFRRRDHPPVQTSLVPEDAAAQDQEDMLLIRQAGAFLFPADVGDLGFRSPNVVRALGCTYEEVGSSIEDMRSLRRPVVGAWLRLNQQYPDTFGAKNPRKLLNLITLNGEIETADAFAEFGVNAADHPGGIERPGLLLAALPIPPPIPPAPPSA